VAVALGFQRGRLKSVYQVLRGKDLETGVFSDDRRDQQFTLLQEAQVEVLNLTYWHQFLSSLIGAGYRSAEMISSQNALVYAYAFYLIGRQRFDLPEHQLQRLIGRWFFASSLTGRYTSSPETIMDGDLNRLKEVKDGAGFARLLEEMMASELTNDFWTVTLPANLDSSSARNPELFAYIAAQNRLGAPVLFSHKRVSDLLDPSIKSRKKPLERHHLFPRGWLESQGVDDLKRINQVANFALLEWPDNIDISDDSPAEYVPKIQPRFSGEEWSKMQEHHALPENWHGISYDAFLIERRKLMAAIIRKGFESLKQAAVCDDSASMGPVDVVSPESTESWRAAQADSIPMTTADGGAATTETNDKEGANTGAGALSVHRQFQSKFWTAFRAYVEAKGSTIRCQKPLPQHWMNHAIGRSGIHLTSIVSTWNSETNSKGPEIRAEVYFDGPRAKQDFAALERQKESIDSALGFPVTWLNPEGKAMCRIYTRRDADFMNEALWPEQFEWLRQRLEAMHKVFAPIVQSLKLEPTE
jgi:hypothetical protein